VKESVCKRKYVFGKGNRRAPPVWSSIKQKCLVIFVNISYFDLMAHFICVKMDVTNLMERKLS
jgi:hypothetical protein